MNVHIRTASAADVPRLREVIEASVRGLQAEDYSPSQIEGALKSVYGVDSQLIADAISTPEEKSHCSTPQGMPPRFVRSLCIRNGRGAVSGA